MASVEPIDSRAFSLDAELSYTLPAHYLYDADIYVREQEAIFARTWQYVGHARAVDDPGDYIVREIAGESIIVMRGEDAELRGFYNVCSHRAHQLLRGEGNSRAIVCPYHAWTYDTHGSLRRAKNSELVSGFDPAEFCLKPIQVEIFLNFIFVNLDRGASSLKSQTGTLEDEVRSFSPRLNELTLSHRRPYDIEANWKNLIENYCECYHCPRGHPAFAQELVDMASYRITLHDIHHSHRARAKSSAQKAYEFDAGATEHAGEFAGWFLWPNLAIEVYPGGCLNIFHIVPQKPERSSQYIEWYFYDAKPTPAEEEVIEYLHSTVRCEDQVICESVQRGLRSRAYQAGRFIVDAARSDASEHGAHHFQSLVYKALNP